MNRVIISTVGTSLNTNFKDSKERKFSELINHLKSGKATSAELSVFDELAITKEDILFFIATNTNESKEIAKAYRIFYEEKGYIVFVKVLKYYTLESKLIQTKGLPELFKTFSEIYHKYYSYRDIIINATGGFKAQTAYATLFGILSKSEVVYKSFETKNLIRIPSLPITCDAKYFSEYLDVFDQIVMCEDNKSARNIIDSLPKDLREFFVKRDNLKGYKYSHMGDMFLDLYKDQLIEAKQKNTISKTKEHSTLFGDGITSIDDIKNKEVRVIFKRIYLHSEVKNIYLDEFTKKNKRDHVQLEWREIMKGGLKYYLYTSEGRQRVKIRCDEGKEKKLMDKLGRNIYY